MRIIIYTGKGGVGKTSVAAATALKSAKKGLKTLVMSTDAAHSLGDSFDIKLSAEPAEICKNLWAQEIDTLHEVEKSWGRIQEYFAAVLTSHKVKDITTEEITVFPGFDELLSLLRILGYYREKAYDVIIVDCAPTGETLALLSFPDMMRWWMEKIFPFQKKAVKLVRPVMEPLLGVPMPTDNVMSELENIYNQLDEMRQILSDRNVTSIRIVVNPEKMVIKEAQRSFTYLNIYNFNVDAIIVNRVMPDSVNDDYFSGWKDIQQKYMEMIKESFSPLPIYKAPLFENEIVGVSMLERLGGEVFGDSDPVKMEYNIRTQEIIKENDGYVLAIRMPFVEKKEVSLSQKGDELIVRVGNIKRTVTLPRTLLNYSVKGAKFEDEILRIRFGDDDDR